MSENLNTVGDLRAALADLPDDLVIETYGHSESRAVTIMHVVPDAEEAADGSNAGAAYLILGVGL